MHDDGLLIDAASKVDPLLNIMPPAITKKGTNDEMEEEEGGLGMSNSTEDLRLRVAEAEQDKVGMLDSIRQENRLLSLIHI